jgi:Ankyrin repeats (3 copies)
MSKTKDGAKAKARKAEMVEEKQNNGQRSVTQVKNILKSVLEGESSQVILQASLALAMSVSEDRPVSEGLVPDAENLADIEDQHIYRALVERLYLRAALEMARNHEDRVLLLNQQPYGPGPTIVMLAVEGGEWALVHELLALGADPSQPGGDGATVFHSAIVGNSEGYLPDELIDAFKAAGASPNTPDREGMTPLDLAADIERIDCIAKLIEIGADVSASGIKPALLPALLAEHGYGDLAARLASAKTESSKAATAGKRTKTEQGVKKAKSARKKGK